MPSTSLDRVKMIFTDALEHFGADRAAFLERACHGDPALRAEVEAYLTDEQEAGGFFSRPGLQRDATRDELLQLGLVEAPGALIGRYKLVEMIGEGGFGTVFRAEQQTPVRRVVALKIIKFGMDSKQVIARFEAERQALAMLDHPGIAKVIDAGETATGRPYFVMELVDGLPITDHCDRDKLPPEQRLELFVDICHALQHAHQKGIIHRDIKPGNVLVTMRDAKPVPKLIDFGIAKATQSRLTDKTLFTEHRQLIGTPAYMSPEQAELNGAEVDTRSDIYALGGLLYELLTGTTPFSKEEFSSATFFEIQRKIREVNPPKPSSRIGAMGATLTAAAVNRSIDGRKLALLVRGELDWIVMKALEKDRTRRYESAGELARDVRRYLDDEPVQACPPSTVYLFGKAFRRHRTPVLLTAMLLVLSVIAAAGYVRSIRNEQKKTSAALSEARAQRTTAVNATADALAQRTAAENATGQAMAAGAKANDGAVASALSQARGGLFSVLAGHRFDSLAALTIAKQIHPSIAVRSQVAQCLPLADLQVLKEWKGAGDGLGFNHHFTLFADVDPENGDVLICTVPEKGAALKPPLFRVSKIHANPQVRFSPDDRLVAVGGDVGLVHIFTVDGKSVTDIPAGPAFDFTPDGTCFAAGNSADPVTLFDVTSWKPRERLKIAAGFVLAFSQDGGRIVTWNGYGSPAREIKVADLRTGQIGSLPASNTTMSAALNPNGTCVAIGRTDEKINRWDVTDLDHPVPFSTTMTGHTGAVYGVVFSNGGDLIASTSGSDHTVRLWDAISGREVVWLAGSGPIGFSADDQLLSIADFAMGTHKVVAVATGRARRTFLPPPLFNHRDVAFSPDGRIMACAGLNVVRFWNLSDPADYLKPVDLPLPDDQGRQVQFSPDGKRLLMRSDKGLSQIFLSETAGSTAAGRPVLPRLIINPTPMLLLSLPSQGDGRIQFTNDSRHVGLAQYQHPPRLIDLDDPKKTVVFSGGSPSTIYLSVSPDGKWVATGTWKAKTGPYVSVWNAVTGARVMNLPIPGTAEVAFSPDGKYLVTCASTGYRFWEVGTWVPVRAADKNLESPWAIPFTSDGASLAVESRTRGVRLIESATGNELVTLDDLDQECPIGFSRDGGLLVTYGLDQTLRLWDIRKVRQELAGMGLDWPAPPLPPAVAVAKFELVLGKPVPVTALRKSLQKIIDQLDTELRH